MFARPSAALTSLTLAAALLLLLTTGRAHAQPRCPAPADSLAQAFFDEHEPVGLVVGVTGPSGRCVSGFGEVTRGSGRAPGAETVFEIGSITKVFTALLLAEQAERGAVALGDSIGPYLPDSVHAPTFEATPIRLRHLATHTSGLPRMPSNFAPANPADPYVDYGPAALYAFLDGYTLERAPGAAYAYSNLGAGLLGNLLARAADQSYKSLLWTHVLGPLGLHHTRFAPLPDRLRPRLGQGYGPLNNATGPWHFDALAGAGALRSTASDMLAFLEANLRPEATPLKAALRRTHQSEHAIEETQLEEGKPLSVALGWHLSAPDSARPLFWHNGGTGGYKSFAGFVPAAGVGVVVMTNTNWEITRLGARLLRAVANGEQ